MRLQRTREHTQQSGSMGTDMKEPDTIASAPCAIVMLGRGVIDRNADGIITWDEEKHPLNRAQYAVLKATYGIATPGKCLCAGWVTSVFHRAGIGIYLGNASDMYRKFCTSGDLAQLRPGMIVAVPEHDRSFVGRVYGHVAIYVGRGFVKDNVGHIRKVPLCAWCRYYGSLHAPQWGWMGGVKLV